MATNRSSPGGRPRFRRCPRGAAGVVLAATVLLAAGAIFAPAARAGDAYVDSLTALRAKREARLRSPQGWLAVAGLSWLKPGENAFGSDSSLAVPLPAGAGPARAGVFVLEETAGGPRVTVRAAPGVDLRLEGEPVTEKVLAADDTGHPDRLQLGRLTFWVIRRAELTGIRLRDPESPILRDFTGVDFFPIDAAYRVTGTLEPFPGPTRIPVPSMIGTVDSVASPGRVRFSLEGRSLSLVPIAEDPDDPSDLFFIFQDATSGGETYGAGRFLSARLGDDGHVVLDFNQAYNPPCAFNPFTTCPLPPEGNVLPVPVRAGEKAYRESLH